MDLNFLNPLISTAAALGGVFLGSWLTNRREREKRQSDFVMRQLAEFYGPLVSLRSQIRARTNLRGRIDHALNSIHQRETAEAPLYTRDAQRRISQEHTEMLMTVTQDEWKIFCDVIMPLYREMLKVFEDKIWLADPSTREYISPFIEFLDIWERHLRDAIPGDVIREIGHTEEKLHPFYTHLEETHDRLQRDISGGSR